ncbi:MULTISPECIES: transglutaminase-like cysteine peptidase [Ferrimonas]|uniref:transglutaminase-like cysteine peptidase n=1 Tax=Ferrimonas TaxID=44011 RepID=UPI001FE1DB7F|nr:MULTISPECIES: transglutaminase-like cysteine peptidase [Ferrimonas]
MIILVLLASSVGAEPLPQWRAFFAPDRLARVEQHFGAEGVAEVMKLHDFIDARLQLSLPAAAHLKPVNDYFNQYRFVSDQRHWQQADYWATPFEFVASGGGDCEDFSLAKFFTLRVLGMPSVRMRLMYAKALELNQAHMVLTYLEQEQAMPLVLDNLNKTILPGDQRPDLLPVYSFNGEGLWRARAFDQGVRLKQGENGILLWQELLERLAAGEGR